MPFWAIKRDTITSRLSNHTISDASRQAVPVEASETRAPANHNGLLPTFEQTQLPLRRIQLHQRLHNRFHASIPSPKFTTW
jgi:hypothetical protein